MPNKRERGAGLGGEINSLTSSGLLGGGGARRTRGSMASVLEMMSVTLAVMPSPSQMRGPVPIRELLLSLSLYVCRQCGRS